MGLFSRLRRIGSSGFNRAVNFTDGTTPAKNLDTAPAAYRVVVVAAVVLLGGMGWFVWNAFQQPLRASKKAPNANSASASAVAQLEKLRTKDTDGDGLNDYDELFSYHSSPYLFSSAGDGVSDSVKAQKGLDPNCPQGTTCTPVSLDLNASASNTNGLSVPFLRAALKASGVPATTVDQATDSALLNIYRQTISNDGNVNADAVPTLDSLSQLSGSDIRSLLQESGVDATTLSTVDDTTLKTIFGQALTDSSNTNS